MEACETKPEVLAIVAAAGLHYVDSEDAGLSRVRRGNGFSYVAPDGTTVSDPAERARIEAIVIPPAWSDVWITPDPKGHLLATGRDQRGRKQYRYHPGWREVRDADKFQRLGSFAKALPTLRSTVEADLQLRGIGQRRIVALVIRLLDDTLIRVGNPEYADDNESYGLTTLQDDHLAVEGDRLAFDFVGKSGVSQRIAIRDKRLARLAQRCHELPGKRLFSYRNTETGTSSAVTSGDVNSYLHEVMGPNTSAKDFRTWGGTTIAAAALAQSPVPETKVAIDREVLGAYDMAAAALGNTRAVCRACYVHPLIPESYTSGDLHEAWAHSRSGVQLSRPESTVRRLLNEA